MDLRELEYFVTIVQKENLTKAAEVLFVSQPTLTKFVQRLEKEQGIPLFRHVGKQWKLTYAGQRFYAYVEKILSLEQALQKEMTDIKKQDIGLLNIGLPPVRCSLALPVVLPAFRKTFPNVEVQVMEDSSANLEKALWEGSVDLVFGNLVEPKPGFHYMVLSNDSLYAILPSGHPIGERAIPTPDGKEKGICLEWLQEETFILQKRTQRQGEYILRELKEKGIVLRKVQHTTNIRAAAALAACGYGVAFLSGAFIPHACPICPYDIYRLLDTTYPLDYVASWREGDYIPRYAHSFIDLMKEAHDKHYKL